LLKNAIKQGPPHHSSPGGSISPPGSLRTNPKNWAETTRHLVARDEPPGDFWVKP